MNEKKIGLKKWDIRLSFLSLREKIPLERRQSAHPAFLTTVSEKLLPYSTVLSFCSTEFEIDTHQINEWILQHKQLALPRMEGDHIVPYLVKDQQSDLERSNWKIMQPKNSCVKLSIDAIDCVIVPGVCFDAFNNRIGFGKGHYDRLLKKMPHAYLIGVGYKEQEYNGTLPQQHHDVQMNTVLLF